jgi:hypothetical protein
MGQYSLGDVSGRLRFSRAYTDSTTSVDVEHIGTRPESIITSSPTVGFLLKQAASFSILYIAERHRERDESLLSSTHVDKLRPPLRRRLLRPELLDCTVQRIRHGIRVDRFAGQELLVEPLRHVWSIGITNGPVSLVRFVGYAASL